MKNGYMVFRKKFQGRNKKVRGKTAPGIEKVKILC